jgi:MoaA/NifB/PqqE/SkfB family radical SAM enzyme
MLDNSPAIDIDYIYIELSNYCNFSCDFCPYGEMRRKKGRMRKEQAFALIDEIAEGKFSYKDLTFSVLGEPLMYTGFVEVLEYATGKGISVNLNTNASLMTPDLLKQILDCVPYRIVFSVQTPDKSTFQHRGAHALSYESYMNRITKCVESYITESVYGNVPETRVEIHYMNTSKYKPNCDLVSSQKQVVSLIAEWDAKIGEIVRGLPSREGYDVLGIDTRTIEHLLDGSGGEGHCVEIFPKLGVRFRRAVRWNSVDCDGELDSDDAGSCAIPSKQITILWNGDFVLCCLDYDGINVQGNVWDMGGIEKVWNSQKAKRHRQELMSGCFKSLLCRKCRGKMPLC